MELEGTYRNGVIVPDEPPMLSEGTRIVFEAKPQARSEAPADECGPTLLSLLAFAGIVKDIPADFAMEHDHYIHGTPRRKPLDVQ